jgi:hypothetical protein
MIFHIFHFRKQKLKETMHANYGRNLAYIVTFLVSSSEKD